MSENGTSKLDSYLSDGKFKGIMNNPKPKRVTISSNGVITFNRSLKESVYKAGGEARNVSITVNNESNEILILIGDENTTVGGLANPDAKLGATNSAVSAINVLKQLQEENNITILPNGEKTSSYRFEDKNNGLEILEEKEGLLAILLRNSSGYRQRNAIQKTVQLGGVDIVYSDNESLDEVKRIKEDVSTA